MRKRLISVYIVVFLASCICACTQTVEETPVAETENEEQEDTEAADEDETDAADEISESEEQASPIYVIYPQPTQDNTYEIQDWHMAYEEYIEGLEWNSACTYSLIYVDDDDIPELVIDSGFEAGGCEILTYHSGEIDVLQTDRRLFYYIEKKNLINNTGGAYGYYYDRIYIIENGKWVCIADGEQTEITGEDWVFRYEWDGAEVEEDVYEKSLNAVFDREQGIEPDQYYIMDEMLSLFRTGDVASQNHRYALFVEDVTWSEAKSRCEESGGYLATITSTEEYERIQKGIVDSHQTDISFWVGASDNEEVLGQKIFGFGWLEPGKEPDAYCMLDHFNALFAFWEPDEPSYRVEAGGKTIKEEFAYLLYDDTEEKCFLYDAPMDMLSVWPEYTGKIGYICEYDSPDVKDITWEQVGYNVVDLHFTFEDTVIDREIVAYDVRDIVYKDITGDGIDEVLIYCDFANNTCDWQLIYFYQIEQGNVTDISPSSEDIPELNNADWGIWNMWWVAAETMEGYSSPIYKLEDYYKENGVVYVQETLYIGYRDGKWELVQGFD